MVARSNAPQETRCTAFEGTRRIASGDPATVARATKAVLDRGEDAPVLIFDDRTSQLVEIDFRGTVNDVLARLARPEPAPRPEEPAARRGPGRPKLGVVSREITLLPRHWDWLASQPGGASVALRKLVEDARRVSGDRDRVRVAREVTYRFLFAMAGDLPDFEEATRALFANDRARFEEKLAAWPADVRDHALGLATSAFEERP
ncbi:MAG: DUF2239 family protein [bacterium]